MKETKTPKVVFQPETHSSFRNGINFIVDAVRPTLGPVTRITAIEQIRNRNALPEMLDSGGEIARRIVQLGNRSDDVGAMFLRHVLWSIFENVGDGTVSGAVIFETLFNDGIKYLASGMNAMLLRNYLIEAIDLALVDLEKQAVMVKSQVNLQDVAESICYDRELAEKLGEIFWVIGQHGQIEIRKSHSRNLRSKFVEGRYWQTKLINQDALKSLVRQRIMLENPAIIVSDLNIDNTRGCLIAIETAVNAGERQLLILCSEVNETVVGILNTVNKHPEKFQVYAVKTPGLTHEEKMLFVHDFSILVGAEPRHQAAGESLSGLTLGHFGHARRVWIEKDYFGIMAVQGDPILLRTHAHNLMRFYAREEDKELKERLLKRIGYLMGGSATLSVGANTPNEQEFRLALADRSAKAIRGVIAEGIVPGGGVALLNCRTSLQNELTRQDLKLEHRTAYQMLIKALEAPFRTIISNAGGEHHEIMAEVRIAGKGYGYDVRTKSICKPEEVGLWDSFLTTKTVLATIVKSVALALTTDVIVHVSNPEQAIEP